MISKIIDTEQAIYRITNCGRVFTQSKCKIPLVTKGRVFSGEYKHITKPERELSYRINNRGYLTVRLAGKTKMVHRLVAECFISNPLNKGYINHLDGNKLNNKVDNLAWCTIAENNAHAIATGLKTFKKGYKITYKSQESKARALSNLKDKSALTDDEVRYCRNVYLARCKEYGVNALARKFNISSTAMSNIVRRKTYKHIK